MSLVRRVFGDGLRAFRDGVLGEFPRQHETSDTLDLAGRERVALVVVRQVRRLMREALEDVHDEGVHDGHRLGRDALVVVHLQEDSK